MDSPANFAERVRIKGRQMAIAPLVKLVTARSFQTSKLSAQRIGLWRRFSVGAISVGFAVFLTITAAIIPGSETNARSGFIFALVELGSCSIGSLAIWFSATTQPKLRQEFDTSHGFASYHVPVKPSICAIQLLLLWGVAAIAFIVAVLAAIISIWLTI